MTEFIVIATRYIFLLLKLRITFVSFLTAGSAAKTRVNECHSFTDRVQNPMQQPRDSTRVEKYFLIFFHSYERTSCVDYTTGSLIKNLCAYVLILFYMTTTLKKCFYSGKHTDFENENKGHRLRCRCLPHFCHHCLGWTRTAHASNGSVVHVFDLTSLVDSLPRETCVGEILSSGAWK